MKTTLEIPLHDLAVIGMCVTFCAENLDKFYTRWQIAAKLLGLPQTSKEEVEKKLNEVNSFLISKSAENILNKFKEIH